MTSQHSSPLRKPIVVDAKGRNAYKWEINYHTTQY